jgi:hypothetical protein
VLIVGPEVVEGPLVELDAELELAAAGLVDGLVEVELEAVLVVAEAEEGLSNR